ncbi:hypothetical protein ABT336_11815 [Micromonospora sp. NPDC000207]|uniref:hypothetical protein n=1 Tax=Micromonospora sp. NPDC000207 TaxID=3154246 RepID=UPI00331ADBC0
MEKPRYIVQPGPRPGVWTVVDTVNGQVVMRERDETMIRRFAEARNNLPPQPATPAPSPAAPARQTGWSNAAKRRSGRTGRSHPLGEVIETGDGHTVYTDTAFGGGRVQIWDES